MYFSRLPAAMRPEGIQKAEKFLTQGRFLNSIKGAGRSIFFEKARKYFRCLAIANGVQF